MWHVWPLLWMFLFPSQCMVSAAFPTKKPTIEDIPSSPTQAMALFTPPLLPSPILPPNYPQPPFLPHLLQ